MFKWAESRWKIIHEAEAVVNKILTYEKNPPENFAERMLFLAMVLWSDPYTDSRLGKNFIDEMFIPENFDPIEKLYQSLGNETYENVMAALNTGFNFINHSGHAWWYSLGIGNYVHLTNADMDALTNNPANSILYSIGCWPAAFDYNCFAEHFLYNPNGGGVAFVGNSRYGWGSPGNPLFGYSDRFDQQFYHSIFTENIFHIGETLGAIKTHFIPLAGEENVYRWCEYEINLLGDPEMPIWTQNPDSLQIGYNQRIYTGQNHYFVSVLDSNLLPIQDARVCLMQEDEIYQTGFTDLAGQLEFDFEIVNPDEEVYLTVTAHNYYPFETELEIISNETYLDIIAYSTNGSAVGYVNPDDTISLDITLQNFSNTAIDSLLINIQT